MDEFVRDPVGLGKTVILLIFIWLGADTIYGLASGYEAMLLGAGDVAGAMTANDTAATDMVVGLIALVFVLVNIATIIMSARWIYRVNKNAHSLSDAMTITPGWNIGWFFIPVASLFKPFEGIRQTWQVSHDPDDPVSVPVPSWMRWWWGLWIIASILGNISFRLSMSTNSVDAQIAAHAIDAISLLFDAPLAFLFARLIRTLSQAQSAALNRQVFA